MAYKVSGTDITMNEEPSQAQQFMALLGQTIGQSLGKRQETKSKREKEQIEYYITLREAGYSEDQATERVNKQYKGPWMQRLLNKDSAGFQKPEGDPFTQKQEKESAETELTKAKASYYRAGGSRRTVIDKMTPNQLQQRQKLLLGMLDPLMQLDLKPEKKAELREELEYINSRMQELSGFKNQRSEGIESVAKEYVVMTGPDGKQYKIPKANVSKARARGFK